MIFYTYLYGLRWIYLRSISFSWLPREVIDTHNATVCIKPIETIFLRTKTVPVILNFSLLVKVYNDNGFSAWRAFDTY